MGDGPAPVPTFAERLDRLFRTMHPADRGEFSYREVEAGVREIAEREGDVEGALSASYVCNLRRGRRTNPTLKQLNYLAAFFKVPPTYFLGTVEEIDRIDVQLALVEVIREKDVRDIARRTADLSDAGRQAVRALITSLASVPGMTRPRTRRPRARPGPGDAGPEDTAGESGR